LLPPPEEAAAGVEEGEDAAADDDEEELYEPPASTVAATSWGIFMGVLARAEKSTTPLWEIVSGFMARKDLVKAMFSTAYDWDHCGILFMSMPFPQDWAAGLLEVALVIYDTAAEVELYCWARAGIMLEALEGCPQALGGLMIPNIPFSQWVGVPQ
jgi:hypothetical protein